MECEKYSKAKIKCSYCGNEDTVDINSKIRYKQNCLCRVKIDCIYCKESFNPKTPQAKSRPSCYKCNPYDDLGKYTQRQRDLNREKLREEGYTKCELCGYNKCWEALDFHHKGGKEFGIGEISHHSYEKILKEVKKCVMVCANCHREIHAGYIKLEEGK